MTDLTLTPKNLIAAERVTGTDVYNLQGDKLGTVEDIMIDKVSGRAIYAVMSFGGFLGIGEKHHPLPWSTLDYQKERDGYVVNMTKEQLQAAPADGEGCPTGRGRDQEATPLLRQARDQLQEYFDAKRMSFDLPLAPVGSDFQKRVWAALCAIPPGETRSYADIARAVSSAPHERTPRSPTSPPWGQPLRTPSGSAPSTRSSPPPRSAKPSSTARQTALPWW